MIYENSVIFEKFIRSDRKNYIRKKHDERNYFS